MLEIVNVSHLQSRSGAADTLHAVRCGLQKEFFLSKNGSHVGPFQFEDVLSRLADKEHTWMDYVYDEGAQDWIVLMEHPQFTEKFNSGWARHAAQPIEEPRVTELLVENPHREKAWYLLKEENNYGPFSMLDIVQMLQKKSVHEFDWVWKHGMRSWKRLSEVSEFCSENIQQLHNQADDDVAEVFYRRRHARAKYGCSLIVHNQKTLFRAKAFEISEGGGGFYISNGDFEPGDKLYLHFQPGDGVPPFNSVCSVVSKNGSVKTVGHLLLSTV